MNEQQEREAFEAQHRKFDIRKHDSSLCQYSNQNTNLRWLGWLARAALAHPPEQPNLPMQLPPLTEVMYHAFRGYELECTTGGDESTTVYLDDSVLDEIWDNINTALRVAGVKATQEDQAALRGKAEQQDQGDLAPASESRPCVSAPWRVACSKGTREVMPGMRWRDGLTGSVWEVVEPSADRIYSPSGFGGTVCFWCRHIGAPQSEEASRWLRESRADGCVLFCGDSVAVGLIDAALADTQQSSHGSEGDRS